MSDETAKQMRNECNNLTTEEREKLFKQGMAVIYGGGLNKKREAQGREPLPPEPWVGREVSWSHQANGKTYFFSGDIVDVFYPDDDPSDFSRRWMRFKRRYGCDNAEGKSKHPRIAVRLDNGNGYRFPLMHKITFRDSTPGNHE